jgi:hypothetical protein
VIKGKDIVVWFSCGAASAVAAKVTLEKYGEDNNVRIVNNPIKEEHVDNLRFLKDVEKWIGKDIEFALSSKFPNASCKEVWDWKKFMSGPMGAPCTKFLKKNARQEWEKNNNSDYLVLGFTYDEQKRAERFMLTERNNLLPVLIEEKITKQDCFDMLLNKGLKLPQIYKHGFPNANCIGCVKATSPTYWNLVRKEFPKVFDDRAEQSYRIGTKLVRVNGKRMFLKDLPPDAKSLPLKNYHIECGIFCEEFVK